MSFLVIYKITSISLIPRKPKNNNNKKENTIDTSKILNRVLILSWGNPQNLSLVYTFKTTCNKKSYKWKATIFQGILKKDANFSFLSNTLSLLSLVENVAAYQ